MTVAPPPAARSRLRLAAGYAIAAAALAFAFRYLHVNGSQFVSALAAIEPAAVFTSVLCFSLVLAVNASAFAAAGKAFGISAARADLGAAWLASLLSKYIPVGVGHIAGRGVLLASRGVGWRPIVATGVFEQVVSIAWCALLAWGMHVRSGWPILVALGVAVGAGTLVSARTLRSIGVASQKACALSVLLYGAAMLPYALGYLVLVEPVDAARFVSALFAATVAGVLAVVAPGGLGVRESLTAALSLEPEASGVVAGLLVARLLIIVTEVAGTLAGGWWLVRGQAGNRHAG